jgi:hypothetical protein
MEIDSDYWIKNVKYGQIRGRIIQEFLDLMDKEYQERKWLESNGGYGYDTQIGFAAEMFFDELNLAENVKTSTPPLEDIGDFYKTKEEAIAMLDVCSLLRPMYHNLKRDDEYVSSPFLSRLREKSRAAFLIFMENEKENEEFCKFILGIIEQQTRYKVDNSKTTYENIVFYANSIVEF